MASGLSAMERSFLEREWSGQIRTSTGNRSGTLSNTSPSGQTGRIMVTLEIAVVVILIVINGFLAMAELAIVSSRPARLKMMADQGTGGARRALALSENPGRFLSTVQIGITLVGVLSGAFSGATLGLRFGHWLGAMGLTPAAAEALGVGSVEVAITY